jgi:di/tricarboxylate transporter
MLDNHPKRKFLAELTISEGSKYIGESISSIKEISKKAKIIDIIRNGESATTDLKKFILQQNDCIVIEANAGEVIGLKENGKLDFTNLNSDISKVSAEEKVTLEGSINSNSSLIGKKLSSLNMHRKYGVYILAVHRNEDQKEDLNNIVLKFGDTLLIEGSAENISELLDRGNIVNIASPQEKPMLKSKAPIAILTIISVMALSAFEVMPIASLALIGAVTVMITGCVETEEAYRSIDWRILFLIFGMLGLSIGLQKTGAINLIVDQIITLVGGMGPLVILAAVYVLTSILTEMVSNNAVAVLLGPIAINLATQLGFDPKPFLMAVLFAASASFATPIGYQTNTFVYGAGGYKFTDFLKIGVPLNIIFAIVAIIILPIFFPF